MDDKKKKILFFAIGGGVLLILLVLLLVLMLSSGGGDDVSSNGQPNQSTTKAQTNTTDIGSTDSQTESSVTGDSESTQGITGNTQINTTSSIKTTKSNETTTTKEGSPVSETPVIDTTQYNLYTYSQRLWLGDTVYNESVYPMTTKSGSNEVIQLLYDATSIIEVRSPDLKKVYKAGVDYKLQNGKLVIPEGSSIPVNSYNNYYLDNAIADHSQKRLNGGFIYFSEGDVFHKRQIAVTYKHSTKWAGPIPTKDGAKLPKLQAIIKNKEPLTIVYCGDSISCGANASSTVGASPMTPKWTEMFTDSLEKMGVSVTDFNTSMGGQVSQWAATNAQAKINRYSPDLVVLGWGMNDGSLWNNVSPSTYKANIKLTINKIRAALPDSEIILIGTMLPNPEAVEFVGPHEEYTARLYEIQKEYSGVAVANMTQIHKYILTRKNYRDITGNNVNHPNDFISRMYLQVMLETISK